MAAAVAAAATAAAAAAAATAAAQPIRGACHVCWASLEPRGSRNSRGEGVLRVTPRVRLISAIGWRGVGCIAREPKR